MTLLGPSLADLLRFCGGSFSLKTVLMLGLQMVQRIQHMHTQTFIHRDIKPENFLMGLDDQSHVLYMIDLGFATSHVDPVTKKHIKFRKKDSLTGTASFASINAHNGHELSRRDDLESIAYLMVYMFKGNLPWNEIRSELTFKNFSKIKESKEQISLTELIQGFPKEMKQFIMYCREL